MTCSERCGADGASLSMHNAMVTTQLNLVAHVRAAVNTSSSRAPSARCWRLTVCHVWSTSDEDSADRWAIARRRSS